MIIIDTQRHESVFDYKQFLEPIHVIGVGGVGSHVACHLVKLGCGVLNELHVWDGDTVATHNLANQMYDSSDVGHLKVAALQRRASTFGGITLKQHPVFFEPPQQVKGVVFLCVDTMSARRQILNMGIKGNTEVPLFIEVRMDATSVLMHVVDPSNPRHIRQWEKYWYPDEDADNQIAGCGGRVAVGPTASIAADYAVWQFIRYAAIVQGGSDILDNQIRLTMRPLSLKTFQW